MSKLPEVQIDMIVWKLKSQQDTEEEFIQEVTVAEGKKMKKEFDEQGIYCRIISGKAKL